MTPTPYRAISTDREVEYARWRQRMVERQLRRRGITDKRVLAAMAIVPRERFVPPEARHHAYCDGALAIGDDQTISQPWIVAFMTSLLELTGTERVLEVGTGSGYAAAVLARCCREVVTVERHPRLADAARSVLAELGYHNVEVRVGDGSQGARERAPFGGISVTASADQPPSALLTQLAPSAALVMPIRRGASEHLTRFRDGTSESFVAVRFVPLIGERGARPPVRGFEEGGL